MYHSNFQERGYRIYPAFNPPFSHSSTNPKIQYSITFTAILNLPTVYSVLGHRPLTVGSPLADRPFWINSPLDDRRDSFNLPP
jgi:hypothetical protein